jgi:two-component system KDP operon response regulator KdpE
MVTPALTTDRRRVLVVDDDPELRRWIRSNLEEVGYAVIEADSAFEALEELVEKNVDLVLLDRGLPRIDGSRLIRAYGSAEFPVPIIAMTGASDASDFAREVGAAAYLAKPFGLDDLFTAIRRARGTDEW